LSPSGAGANWNTAHNQHFAGKDIVIITDNDKAGENYGKNISENLVNIANSVKVIPSAIIAQMAGFVLQEKGDISDISAQIGLQNAQAALITEEAKTPFLAVQNLQQVQLSPIQQPQQLTQSPQFAEQPPFPPMPSFDNYDFPEPLYTANYTAFMDNSTMPNVEPPVFEPSAPSFVGSPPQYVGCKMCKVLAKSGEI
jgi:hypothetical protein